MKPKQKRKDRRFYLEELSSQMRDGGNYVVSDKTTQATAAHPLRVETVRVRDKNNPKSWYTKFILITPAANENRPMEPVFNVAFNDNGTSGVPKFVDLDVEWIGFAETFMMDQVTYNAMQNIRLALKSNLTYNQDMVKRCLVNGIALAIVGKILERDVHWNLYDAGDDFNFQMMYRLRNTAVGGYGIVSLEELDYLKDTKLPYTNTIYDKIVSMYNNVLRLPKNIGEFISHYFGSLFTLDRDGKNDQYLRINMHEVDWYDNDGNPTTLDLSNMDLDYYMELLNAYSKQFAIVLADLRKCLSVDRIGIQRYDSYAYTFIYDKSLLQALINGYTDTSAIKNNFVRLDRIPGVEDNLTQFLFLGAIQPNDISPSRVHAIKILDMVLKINSDANLKWPRNLDQLPFAGNTNPEVVMNGPFGLSIITAIRSDNTHVVTLSTSGKSQFAAIPTYPTFEPALTARESVEVTLGLTKGFYPSQQGVNLDEIYSFDFNNIDNVRMFGAIYMGAAIKYVNPTSGYVSFWFVGTQVNAADQGTDSPRRALSHVYILESGTLSYQDAVKLIDNVQAVLKSGYLIGLYGDTLSAAKTAEALMANINLGLGFLTSERLTNSGQALLIDPPTASDIGITFRRFLGDLWAYISIPKDGFCYVKWGFGTSRLAFAPNSSVAPAGLISVRQVATTATYSSNNISVSGTAGLDGLAPFVSQVVDYHIPVYYKRYDYTKFYQDGDLVIDKTSSSGATLIKEDYIPYYYNVLDLIPVLYEMFVSLFSIDAMIKQQKRNSNSDK